MRKALHTVPSNNSYRHVLDNDALPAILEGKGWGVTVTQDLNWGIHSEKCIGKANRMISWTTRNTKRNSLKTMMVIYK